MAVNEKNNVQDAREQMLKNTAVMEAHLKDVQELSTEFSLLIQQLKEVIADGH
jgi:hypothetical protein